MVDDAAPAEERDHIPEPSQKPLLSQAELLERGHPGEYLPGRDRDAMVLLAERYVADAGNPPEGRERVRRVWLQKRYEPAYQRFTPRPGKEPQPAVTADDFG